MASCGTLGGVFISVLEGNELSEVDEKTSAVGSEESDSVAVVVPTTLSVN